MSPRYRIALACVLLVLFAVFAREWRQARLRAAAGDNPADTLCLAAKIGLSCR